MTNRFRTTKQDIDNFNKCINIGVRVYPIPIYKEPNMYYIEVDVLGRLQRSRDKSGKLIKYKEQKCWTKIFKYYEYYAKKN